VQLDPPAHGAATRRQLRPSLLWSGLALLAAVAIALAMVIASLALELGSDQAPTPAPPVQISPPGGHAMAQ